MGANKRRAFTRIETLAIFARDKGTCRLCLQPVIPNEVEIDHVIPLARGGSHEPTNWQLAHRRCNRRKGAGPRPNVSSRDTSNGTDVKAWREQHGLTQRQLANLLDIDPQTVSRWERDERKPRGRVLELALERLDELLKADVAQSR